MRTIPLFRPWIASVLLLSAAAAGLAIMLATRTPAVVERTAPAAALPEPSAETLRQAESLRALNRSLQDRIDAMQGDGTPPPCPPGTARDPSATPAPLVTPPGLPAETRGSTAG